MTFVKVYLNIMENLIFLPDPGTFENHGVPYHSIAPIFKVLHVSEILFTS